MFESTFGAIGKLKKIKRQSMPSNHQYEKMLLDINSQHKKAECKQKTKHKGKV